MAASGLVFFAAGIGVFAGFFIAFAKRSDIYRKRLADAGQHRRHCRLGKRLSHCLRYTLEARFFYPDYGRDKSCNVLNQKLLSIAQPTSTTSVKRLFAITFVRFQRRLLVAAVLVELLIHDSVRGRGLKSVLR